MRPRDTPTTVALRAFLLAVCLAGLAACVAGPPRWEWLTRGQTPGQRQASAVLRAGGPSVGRAAGFVLFAAGAAVALLPPGLTVPKWRRPAGLDPAGRLGRVLAAVTRRSTRV